MEMDRKMEKSTEQVHIMEPLVDENLSPLESASKVVSLLSDETKHFEVHVHVANKEMVPTAISFSLSKRLNVDLIAQISDFPGSHFVYSFLKSSKAYVGVTHAK